MCLCTKVLSSLWWQCILKSYTSYYRQAMSIEQLNAFQEAVNADAILRQKLKAATDTDTVLSIARAAGFLFSADELSMRELSDEDLEMVAGGAWLRGPQADGGW